MDGKAIFIQRAKRALFLQPAEHMLQLCDKSRKLQFFRKRKKMGFFFVQPPVSQGAEKIMGLREGPRSPLVYVSSFHLTIGYMFIIKEYEVEGMLG